MWIWSNTAKQYDERFCSVYSLQCVQQALLDLFTEQPHTRYLQGVGITTTPTEVVIAVHQRAAAVAVPESTAVVCCTVQWWMLVVVSVECAKHSSIAQCITDVTPEPKSLQSVVVQLWKYFERSVLDVVPVVAAAASWPQVNHQLISAAHCQLMDDFIAKPIAATRVVETDFKLRPWTVEDVRSMNLLLNQQRNAAVYTEHSFTSSHQQIKQTHVLMCL